MLFFTVEHFRVFKVFHHNPKTTLSLTTFAHAFIFILRKRFYISDVNALLFTRREFGGTSDCLSIVLDLA